MDKDKPSKKKSRSRLDKIRTKMDPTRPFPHILPNGQVIVDETCTCQHSRLAHTNTVAVGHGSCLTVGCTCSRYSFKARIVVSAEEALRRLFPTA